MSFLPGMFPSVSGSDTLPPPDPPSVSYIGSTVDGADLSTYTFTSHAIGGADATRRVLVGITYAATVTRTLSSPTIGGVPATFHCANFGSGGGAIMMSALVSTGTTADIVLPFSGGCTEVTVNVWRAVNETSALPHATMTDFTFTGNDKLNGTINVPADGWIVASAQIKVAGGPIASTWIGVTPDYNAIGETTGSTHDAAHQSGLTLETGRIVSVEWSGVFESGGALAAVSWG